MSQREDESLYSFIKRLKAILSNIVVSNGIGIHTVQNAYGMNHTSVKSSFLASPKRWKTLSPNFKIHGNGRGK